MEIVRVCNYRKGSSRRTLRLLVVSDIFRGITYFIPYMNRSIYFSVYMENIKNVKYKYKWKLIEFFCEISCEIEYDMIYSYIGCLFSSNCCIYILLFRVCTFYTFMKETRDLI